MITKKRKTELRNIVGELKKTLPQLKPVDNAQLEKCYDAKDYAGIVSSIKKHMAIHFRISIKYYTDAGAPKSSLRENAVAPMQVLIPDSLPHYGVAQEKITIVLRIFEKSLVTGSYHAFIVGISHELSHLVLYGTYHSLRFSEEATDITAMVLGYSKYYESGHSTFGSDGLSKLGYLTFEEVMFVAQVIDGTLPHDRESLFDKALTWIKDRIGV